MNPYICIVKFTFKKHEGTTLSVSIHLRIKNIFFHLKLLVLNKEKQIIAQTFEYSDKNKKDAIRVTVEYRSVRTKS